MLQSERSAPQEHSTCLSGPLYSGREKTLLKAAQAVDRLALIWSPAKVKPPQSPGGGLTLYGHRSPRLYRAPIESRPHPFGNILGGLGADSPQRPRLSFGLQKLDADQGSKFSAD